jgi:N-methylhydantoinase A/oxoprolinase/acetone carboxylase beta subunit
MDAAELLMRYGRSGGRGKKATLTVATNPLIQNRGASTGLITSDGFRDLLEIGREKRPDLYDLQADKPPVLRRKPTPDL